MSTVPVTFYMESHDGELGAAFLMLSAAHDYLDEFIREHPDRVDDNVHQAYAHTQNAHGLLDSDFYTEANANPARTTD